MFREVSLAETPATDPKSLLGRNVEVSADVLTGNRRKYYMKLRFKINSVSERNAFTRFEGYACTRDYLYRIVRKRLQKVETINEIKTKDGWKLQVTTLTVLNRNTETTTQGKVRAEVDRLWKETAEKSTIEDIVKKTIDGAIQNIIRKRGSKIYPVRFSEICKIEVLKTPEE